MYQLLLLIVLLYHQQSFSFIVSRSSTQSLYKSIHRNNVNISPHSIVKRQKHQPSTLHFSPTPFAEPTYLSKVYNCIEFIDDKYANGFILSYANTTGFNYTEPIGALFLLTNVAYFISGVSFLQNNPSPSVFYYNSYVIELAGLLSVNYHYNQLVRGPNQRQVKVALLLDYMSAITAILMVTIEIIHQSVYSSHIPIESIQWTLVASSCLIASWVRFDGLGYIFWHGLWHLFSSAAVYELFKSL